MAFAQPLNDEDDEQQKLHQGFSAPMSPSGGTTSVAGASTSQKPQQQTPGFGGGSGFVNLMDYMKNASNDRAGAVAGKASSFLNAEKDAFNTAAQPIRDAAHGPQAPTEDQVRDTFNMAAPMTTAQNVKQADGTTQGTGVAYAPDDESAPPGAVGPNPHQGAFDQLKSWLDTTYSGPTSVDYTPNAENVARTGLLGGKNTALQEVYGDKLAAQPTSIGNEMLDQALMQGDSGVKAAQADALANMSKFLDDAGAEKEKLDAKGKGLAESADATRKTTADTLKKIYDELGSGIDQRVDATKKAELDAKMKGAGAAPAGQVPGDWKDGQGLDRAGLATNTERGEFDALKALLGTDSLGTGPTYTPGGFGTNPDANVSTPEPGEPNPRTAYYDKSAEQQVVEKLPPEQQQQYALLRKSGMSHVAAMQKLNGGGGSTLDQSGGAGLSAEQHALYLRLREGGYSHEDALKKARGG